MKSSINMDVIFLGAGASNPFGIPTMSGFPDEIERELEGEQLALLKSVRECLSHFSVNSDLEAILYTLNEFENVGSASNISPALLYRFKDQMKNALKERLDEAKMRNIGNLKDAILQIIVKKCTPNEPGKIYSTYDQFFGAIVSQYGGNVESLLSSENFAFFTTNYDTCLEIYFDKARFEKHKDTIYLDQGISSIDMRHWSPTNYRSNKNRLYKLHGSIDMDYTNFGITKYTGDLSQFGEVSRQKGMIFPAVGKSVFEDPYFWMLSMLHQQLETANHAIVIGYSFRDPSVKSLFQSAASSRTDSTKWSRGSALRVYLLAPDASSITKKEFKEDPAFVPVDGKFESEQDLRKLTEALKK